MLAEPGGPGETASRSLQAPGTDQRTDLDRPVDMGGTNSSSGSRGGRYQSPASPASSADSGARW
jgi:hypothetical protein